MSWCLPVSVEIDGEIHEIRDRCDYKIILDIIGTLNDVELTKDEQIRCALIIFYKDVSKIKNMQKAVSEMFKVINVGEEMEQANSQEQPQPKLIDWAFDFPRIAPPVNKVLGYDFRDPNKYTHWYTFVGAYMEIDECTLTTIISIRSKRARGKSLEKNEREFYTKNKHIVDLPQKFTPEEEEFLNSEW